MLLKIGSKITPVYESIDVNTGKESIVYGNPYILKSIGDLKYETI